MWYIPCSLSDVWLTFFPDEGRDERWHKAKWCLLAFRGPGALMSLTALSDRRQTFSSRRAPSVTRGAGEGPECCACTSAPGSDARMRGSDARSPWSRLFHGPVLSVYFDLTVSLSGVSHYILIFKNVYF